jgi:hypothetical protein
MTTRIFSVSPVKRAARPLPDHKEDWTWINDHLDELRGRWVVMHQGELVATSPSIRQLLDKLSRDAYPDAMIAYIPTEEEDRRVVL